MTLFIPSIVTGGRSTHAVGPGHCQRTLSLTGDLTFKFRCTPASLHEGGGGTFMVCVCFASSGAVSPVAHRKMSRPPSERP